MKEKKQDLKALAKAVRAALANLSANKKSLADAEELQTTAQETVSKLKEADPCDTAALDKIQKAKLQLDMLPGRMEALEDAGEKLLEPFYQALRNFRDELMADITNEHTHLVDKVAENLEPYVFEKASAKSAVQNLPKIEGFMRRHGALKYAFNADCPTASLSVNAITHAQHLLKIHAKQEECGSYYSVMVEQGI